MIDLVSLYMHHAYILLINLCVAILKINKDLLLQANDDGAFADVLKHYLQSLHEMIYYMEMDDGGLVGRAKSMTVSKQGCCYAQ